MWQTSLWPPHKKMTCGNVGSTHPLTVSLSSLFLHPSFLRPTATAAVTPPPPPPSSLPIPFITTTAFTITGSAQICLNRRRPHWDFLSLPLLYLPTHFLHTPLPLSTHHCSILTTTTASPFLSTIISSSHLSLPSPSPKHPPSSDLALP